jgi:hypothetical protein
MTTADRAAIRPAPPLDRYPKLTRVPEPPIVDVVRAARCACGGVLTQRAWDDIPTLVAEHNATALHRAWRWSRGIR